MLHRAELAPQTVIPTGVLGRVRSDASLAPPSDFSLSFPSLSSFSFLWPAVARLHTCCYPGAHNFKRTVAFREHVGEEKVAAHGN